MRSRINWAIAPTAIALTFAIASTAAYGQTARTPLNSPIVISGNTGGSQSNESCRGFKFPNAPNQVVQVTEAATSLRFSVEGSNQMAVLITGPGNPLCIPAESSGTIQVPGVWQQGTYSVFVGDRSNGNTPFTLSITQEN